MNFCQRFLDRFYWQEHLEFIGGQGDEAKLLVITFGFLIFRIYEKADAACCFKNLHEFPHRGNQQGSADALPLALFGYRQAAKPDPWHIARQASGIFG